MTVLLRCFGDTDADVVSQPDTTAVRPHARHIRSKIQRTGSE
ncbi:hypothetical protein EGH25_08680 [Haladaptatus sp. F3-133]|uniref:Uncharacterized protein n=1 Tax=Halorutilus salinus TaxID=2487751 RepID=A0A9Q4GGR6_9EURY|nr:hypothetical protein [Halorutilus salinus]MCX2819424.1 hypothetical protein [Halorutilus salinus]